MGRCQFRTNLNSKKGDAASQTNREYKVGDSSEEKLPVQSYQLYRCNKYQYRGE